MKWLTMKCGYTEGKGATKDDEHTKKLNSRSETSGGQAVTPVLVILGVRNAGSEPNIMEDVMVECAKPDPEPPPITATDNSCRQ